MSRLSAWRHRNGYNRPKTRLHHEFLYLNHDTVINALSAFEAGKVDEIIQHTTEARSRDLSGEVGAKGAKVGGAKRSQSTVEEQLVLTRTWFSAFDSWHSHLRSHKAIGTFASWNLDVRASLAVGDTIQFDASVALSPLHKMMMTYLSFVANASSTYSVFAMKPEEKKEAARSARMMESWLTAADGRKHLIVYFLPDDVAEPRLMGRLDENYMIGGLDAVEGQYTVIAQVEALLRPADSESVIRVIRGSPPTPLELRTITEGMRHMIEPSRGLGVTLTDADLSFTYPTVVVRPIAVFR